MDMHPRKRRRHDSEDAPSEADDMDSSATASSIETDSDVEPALARDEDYYHEDGDCVIQVGMVLFKIHRILLEKDSSNFLEMFGMLRQGSDNQLVQKTTDDDPLMLYNDVGDFRALCWFIYALPTAHMQQYDIATADIEKLVSLYLISHEYGFESHKTFAGNLLRKHCLTLEARPSIKRNYFTKCAESRLTNLLETAASTECQQTAQQTLKAGSFPSVLQKVWITRLKKTKESISSPLKLGELLGLRNFVAELYYLELTRMLPVPIKGSIAYAHPLMLDLDPDQKLALYQGYWSLQNYWTDAQEEISKIQFECYRRQHACRQVWKQGWERVKSNKSSPSSFDPLQELNDVRSHIIKLADEKDAHARCALRTIEARITSLKDSIVVHFLGPST